MRLYVDLDSGELLDASLRALRLIAVPRSGAVALDVSFIRGGAEVDPGAVDLRWTVKAAGKFDQSPPLAMTTDFAKSGSGSSALFSASCNYITQALNELLKINGDDGDDAAEAECMAELSWNGDNAGKIPWIRHLVLNDLFKEGDSTPAYTGGVVIDTAIAAGTGSVELVFEQPLASARWHFAGAPVVLNDIDPSPLGLIFIAVRNRSASGATVLISADTDSANYRLQGTVVSD